MEESSLFWVEPPGKDRPALVVGRELLSLYRREYSMTTYDLCKLFRCERRWVHDALRPGIRHICVSHFFRQFIVEQFSLSEEEQEAFLYSSYFYSKRSLEEYWRSHAAATQKTRMIDLADYVDLGAPRAAIGEELERYHHTKRSKAEKEQHFERMREILTPEGYHYYVAAKLGKSSWQAVPLPKLPLTPGDTALCTKADVRHRQGLKTDTSALQWLIHHGAVRIQLEGKTLWSVPPNLYRVPLAVPVDAAFRPEAPFQA